MQRINLLIQKLADMAGSDKNKTVIDIDLMLDYTRVLYADLLELRKNKLLAEQAKQETPEAPAPAVEQTENVPQAVPEPAIVLPNIADVPVVDIRTSIGINDKYLYISELFGDDKTAYDTAIKELNKCNNLQEAMRFADNELNNKYNWDKENPTVQSFYTLLSSSFPSI
jgi:hypothetical protein